MGGGCYKISDERMGWIEAKKMCEATNSQLLSFQSPEEAESLISFIRRIQVFLAIFWSIWPFGRFFDKRASPHRLRLTLARMTCARPDE